MSPLKYNIVISEEDVDDDKPKHASEEAPDDLPGPGAGELVLDDIAAVL